jgi:hypothetical protein
MFGKIITFAITSGLAKKAWDHYQQRDRRREPLKDVTEVVARPNAAAAARGDKKKPAGRRKSEGPGA